jgi:hypothetical protein
MITLLWEIIEIGDVSGFYCNKHGVKQFCVWLDSSREKILLKNCVASVDWKLSIEFEVTAWNTPQSLFMVMQGCIRQPFLKSVMYISE